MNISRLQNCSVFLDTNILIYSFTTTRFTPACEELLEKIRNGVVRGHVNSTVIDEFFHKVLLMQIYAEKRLQPSEAIGFLKKNPERITDFPLPFEATREVLHDYRIIILDTAPLLDETLTISRKYGLLFSDALHAASCMHYSLDHLITNDRDFSRVNHISVIAP
ncbi:putative nucleic acid-binding protein [hydrocarbon metagenome]|uniref:Putative nucleic acid-binding protein n=1 Tax=hydrocarbon metagenome TaxID=938273 RepID=A0A0W8EB25_9ZZZZ